MMDNYSLLLDEFHGEELQQQPNQFIMIINDIRSSKQHKQDILTKRKQQKSKLASIIWDNQLLACSRFDKRTISNHEWVEEQKYLEEINNNNLTKEKEEISKQLIHLNKNIAQIKRHLLLFYKQDGKIQQLKYSSKKLKEIAEKSVKNEKLITRKTISSNQKILKRLHHQKTNLFNQSVSLANKLNLKRYRTKDLNRNKKYFVTNQKPKIKYISQCQTTSYLSQNSNSEQIYSRQTLEQHLRALSFLFTMRDSWTKKQNYKQFAVTKQQIQTQQTQSLASFLFLSKTQITSYYLQKFQLINNQNIAHIIIQFYKKITNNIDKLSDTIHDLSIKHKQLKEEQECQQQRWNYYQQLSRDKATQNIFKQLAKNNEKKGYQIRIISRQIFTIMQQQFKLVNKLKRLRNILSHLTKSTDDCKINDLPQFELNIGQKKQQFIELDKRSSANVNSYNNSEINNVRKMLNLTKSRSTFGLLTLPKKLSYNKDDQRVTVEDNSNSILSYYDQMLSRNPKEMLCQQYDLIKYSTSGTNFLQTVLHNDLYRLFYGSIGYMFDKDQQQNEIILYDKVFALVHDILKQLKRNLTQYIKLTVQACNQIQNKQNLVQIKSHFDSQQKYIIEGRVHDQINEDEITDQKRKGIRNASKQFKNDDIQLLAMDTSKRKLRKQLELNILPKQQSRYTFPYASNCLSTDRQRLCKEDRKIRNLLNHADSLRNKKKAFKQFLCTSRKSFQCRLVNK